jgi:N-acetyl-anhydromuramyl-L-alanine amidase AmpD
MTKPRLNTKYLGCFGGLHSRKNPATAIVIHHTCTKSPERTRSALKKNNYSTHFEVDTDGTIYQYADVNKICCHCGSANFCAIGIDVTHLSGADFPQVQVDAVNELVTWLCDEYNIPQEVHETLSGIYPHRAIGNTVCPQNFPMETLNK